MRRTAFALLLSAILPASAFAQLTIRTIAGSRQGAAFADGPLTAARFASLVGMTIDASGNLIVADLGNSNVRRIGRDGYVTTIAGAIPTSYDLTERAYYGPAEVAVDAAGNVFFSNGGGIQKLDAPQNKVTEFKSTSLAVNALAFGPAGDLFVGAKGMITRIAPDGTESTYAGGSTAGYADGPRLNAKFGSITSLAIASDGTMFVADSTNFVIRKIATDGTVTTLAGKAGDPQPIDGPRETARLDSIMGIALDAAGNLYAADADATSLRRIAPDGSVTTVAGKGAFRISVDGPADKNGFAAPFAVAYDKTGNAVYVADGSAVRKYDVDTAIVSTYAGSENQAGGDDGRADVARFSAPYIAVPDAAGNIYVTQEHAVRKISATGDVTTVAGKWDEAESVDGNASVARFRFPTGLAIGSDGTIYVANTSTLRKITTDGSVTTIAGNPNVTGKTDGPGLDARFNQVQNIALDAAGNLYIADRGNHLIRKMDAAGNVTTFAGTGDAGTSDGPLATAKFANPTDIAIDDSGAIYVSQQGGAIRKIENGQVTTVATVSNGVQSFAIAADHRIYYASPYTGIRLLESNGTSRLLTGFDSANVDGSGQDARLGPRLGLRLDHSGRLIIADPNNNNIRVGTFERPVAQRFVASSYYVKSAGTPVTLSWYTTGLSVTLNGAAGEAVGTTVVTPATTTKYTLSMSGDGGTSSSELTVYVGTAPPHQRATKH